MNKFAARAAGWVLCGCWLAASSAAAATADYDVVVYGGNAAAVIAAVEVAGAGKTVAIVCPEQHLGGLSSGGLGFTDTGNKAVIGGLARDFYHRVWKAYDQDSAWRWQSRESYGNKGQGTPAIDGDQRTQWVFEPHVAEQVFEQYVAEHAIPVFRDSWLDRERGVAKRGAVIESITMTNGESYRAKVFVDATYEGDLLAAAGVDYHVGRESNEHYGEKWNGVQVGVLHHRHHFGVLPKGIDPFVIPGDSGSGLLKGISPLPPGEYGTADHRVQAYCFRLCMTDEAANRVPFPKPDGYDPQNYELLGRVLDAGWRELFDKFDRIPNLKTDTNNHGPVSSDYIGENYDYPEATYERRREIIAAHRRYQQGLLYFMSNDPRVPADVREAMAPWGLAADEFRDNGHWPHQIYVREARRMVGRYVMTENELLKLRPTPESIGMGSYTIDSHNVQRYVTPEGSVQNEGDIGVPTAGPYEIALGSIQPPAEQAANLLVPVAVSSSHIAFGSIRMEPVFMVLGQSAGMVAVMAIEAGSTVQAVPYEALRPRLLGAGQVLEYAGGAPRGLPLAGINGVVVDDEQAEKIGDWQPSVSLSGWIHRGYLHDGNPPRKTATLRFTAELPEPGRYRVEFAFPPHSNRATRVPVTVRHAGGSDTIFVNQKKAIADGPFLALGEFEFSAQGPAAVEVANEAADGHVVADAVRWVRVR